MSEKVKKISDFLNKESKRTSSALSGLSVALRKQRDVQNSRVMSQITKSFDQQRFKLENPSKYLPSGIRQVVGKELEATVEARYFCRLLATAIMMSMADKSEELSNNIILGETMDRETVTGFNDSVTKIRELVESEQRILSQGAGQALGGKLGKIKKEFKKKAGTIEKELGFKSSLLAMELEEEEEALAKGIFAKGDFFEELGAWVLQHGEDHVKPKGGMLSLSKLYLRVKNSKKFKTSFDDVEKAVKRLDKKGAIAGLRTLKSGFKMVDFVPVSMSGDEDTIFEIAAESGGKLTLDAISLKTKRWDIDRIKRVMKMLEENKIAIHQPASLDEPEHWYFPSMWEDEDEW
ncbi:MAG: hypothetical protein ACXAEU_10560 [Candidatus Hodarchaeales archaeon]|jgi:hypothetical protein